MLGNEFDINVGLKKRRKRRSLKDEILKQKSDLFFEKILQAITRDDDVTGDSKTEFFSQDLGNDFQTQQTSQEQLNNNKVNFSSRQYCFLSSIDSGISPLPFCLPSEKLEWINQFLF